MKKQFILAASLLSAIVYGQVGINIANPAATLDIVGKPTLTSSMDGIIAPRIEGAQLRAKTYTSAQTGALVYVTLADTLPAGQTVDVTAIGYYYFNGIKWVSTGAGSSTFTEVDGVIGNEVLNATTNGGLTRAGSGTNASPYTLGLTSGTATGDLMTWNGTAWTPSSAVNIYNSNGTLTNSRTATLNGNSLTFLGTNQSTAISPINGLLQSGLPTSPTKHASAIFIAADNDDNSITSRLNIQIYPEQPGQIMASHDATGLSLATNTTTKSAPITFSTSAGSNALATEKMRITGTEGNVGINTNFPTEKLDNNGITRLRTLPLNGTTNAIYTQSSGTASTTQNQTFTGTRTVVADANGVLGYVSGLPTTGGGTPPSGSINVGETVSQIYSIPAATATVNTFNLGTYVTANGLPALPVLDGLQINLQGVSGNYYDPRVYNVSSTSQFISYQTFATQVNENKTSLNNTVTAGSYVQVDNNNIVFWSTTAAEVETTNLQVQIDANTYRWYEFKWWCMEIGSNKKIFLSITRKA